MAHHRKKVIIKTVILISIIALFYTATLSSKHLYRKHRLKDINKHKGSLRFPKESIKYILYWIPMWDSRTFFFGSDGFELFENCKFNNCFATHNRNIIPIENFDAIIFHTAQFNLKKHSKPEKRKQHQRYIFATIETPIRAYPENLHKLNGFFNWTMTYRYDSDIVRPYGYISRSRSRTNYIMPSKEFFNNKTKLVAWFVSNCYTSNRREILYSKIKQYVDIDVYGPCGNELCPKISHESSEECYNLLEQKYKFYLSFENSHCRDYVTEKLYKILQRNIVPVVYGNVHYKKIAPPYSVIIADNFVNAKELTDHLLHLNNNIKEYLEYFKWKQLYTVETDENKTVCALCKMLHDPLQPPKIYEDIFSWWVGQNLSSCKIGFNLPNISKNTQ